MERGEVDKEGAAVAFDAAKLNKQLDRDPSGHMYTIRYPLAGVDLRPDDPATYLMVGTTRPETMLGDTGVAIHPDNERLAHLIGKQVMLPLVGGPFRSLATPTRIRKRGPARSRSRRPMTSTTGKSASAPTSRSSTSSMPMAFWSMPIRFPAYRGLDRFEARKRVSFADLEARICWKASSPIRTACRMPSGAMRSSSRG